MNSVVEEQKVNSSQDLGRRNKEDTKSASSKEGKESSKRLLSKEEKREKEEKESSKPDEDLNRETTPPLKASEKDPDETSQH